MRHELAQSQEPKAEGRTVWHLDRALLIGALGLTLGAHVILLQRHSISWDEFWYLSFVYDHARGTLSAARQSFHVHFFSWLTRVAGHEVDQILAARTAYLLLLVGTCTCVYLLARRVASLSGALFATLCYAAYSNVFSHGTAFRTDGLSVFLLMTALVLVQSHTRRVVAVAAGAFHSLALRSDGTIAAWGSNAVGQLGHNSTNSSERNFVTVAGLSGVAGIGAGNYHSVAVTTGGTVYAWGLNTEGQVGDGSLVTTRLAPMAVTGLGSGVIAVAAGGRHSLALLVGGTLKAWGANEAGQLGDGSTTQRNAPVQIGTATNWSRVAAGAAFAAGLHVAAASPAGWILEYSLGANPLLHELAAEKFTVVDGMIEIPDRPGLGVTVDEAFVQRHAVAMPS